MSIIQLTSSAYFKRAKTFFFALLIGQLMFGFASVMIMFMGEIDTPSIDIPNLYEILLIAMAAFVLLFFWLSSWIFKKRMEIVKQKNVLKEKMADYNTASLIRYIILELPAILAVVIVMITGEIIFLAYLAVVIAMFLFLTPNRERLKRELELNQAECMLIDDPDAIVCEADMTKNN